VASSVSCSRRFSKRGIHHSIVALEAFQLVKFVVHARQLRSDQSFAPLVSREFTTACSSGWQWLGLARHNSYLSLA
jgi:hypothetical protein